MHWKSNVKGRPRRSMTKSCMFLVCCSMCFYVIHEVIRSINGLLEQIDVVCQVSWSLEVKRPRMSMAFESVALKLPCVSKHVSSSFKYSFWNKFM